VLFGSLCSRKPCNGSTSYPEFRVRAASHSLYLPNGTAGEQTVQWTVFRRRKVPGGMEVMRQRMVNVDLHSSSKVRPVNHVYFALALKKSCGVVGTCVYGSEEPAYNGTTWARISFRFSKIPFNTGF